MLTVDSVSSNVSPIFNPAEIKKTFANKHQPNGDHRSEARLQDQQLPEKLLTTNCSFSSSIRSSIRRWVRSALPVHHTCQRLMGRKKTQDCGLTLITANLSPLKHSSGPQGNVSFNHAIIIFLSLVCTFFTVCKKELNSPSYRCWKQPSTTGTVCVFITFFCLFVCFFPQNTLQNSWTFTKLCCFKSTWNILSDCKN